MVKIDDSKSILKMENLYFESFNFESEGNPITESDNNPEIKFTCQIFGENQEGFSVRIKIGICNEGFYSLHLSLVGEFTVTGGFNSDNSYLRDNAVAIMFPYIRSQVTLLTAQPGMIPIILPPINIKALLSKDDDCD